MNENVYIENFNEENIFTELKLYINIFKEKNYYAIDCSYLNIKDIMKKLNNHTKPITHLIFFKSTYSVPDLIKKFEKENKELNTLFKNLSNTIQNIIFFDLFGWNEVYKFKIDFAY